MIKLAHGDLGLFIEHDPGTVFPYQPDWRPL
ncbi:hypothetical protein AGR1A_Cc40247 [Agrobacterium fabacearum CFBP 5771]|nr:hypothetical protein AGR1A_Cc40247 [Agrobacterium fabacearum CFBP 5771]